MYSDETEYIRIYVKGAPEQLVFNCHLSFDQSGQLIDLTEEIQQYIVRDIVGQKFAQKGLRCLAFAYKDLTLEQFEQLKEENNNFITEKDREQVFFRGLNFVGVFAMQDKIRPEVKEAIKLAKAGNITVRLVSGDHLATAIDFAVQAKIIKPEEIDQSCMTGEEFRRKCNTEVKQDANGKNYLVDSTAFKNLIIKQRVRVIARATPEDKQLLAVGLQDLTRTVALTGEGVNDVKGLKYANVGFAMGSGVSSAKDAAQMILVEDNVLSIINAVLWGRNIYANVRKFIQFQFTVNLSALIILLIVALASGQQAFSVVQLLWLNLIMDMFAALALAAERPQRSVIKNAPFRNSDDIITQAMWVQIIGMTVYVTIVMIFLFFFLDNMWDLGDFSFEQEWFSSEGVASAKCVYFTMLFNTFIYLHLFNEINSRKIRADQFNVFEHILDNFYFLAVFAVTVAVQYFMIQYGGRMARCAVLTSEQHAFSILIGSTSLIASFVLKIIPESLKAKIPRIINERANSDNDPLVKAYLKQANAKVSKGGNNNHKPVKPE